MAVIPGECQRHGQANDERAHQNAIGQLGPIECMSEQLAAVRDGKGSAEVRQSPLQNFVIPDTGPERGRAHWARGRTGRLGFRPRNP
jgi:hypothetical protein